jgi:segregation and condensation protein A
VGDRPNPRPPSSKKRRESSIAGTSLPPVNLPIFEGPLDLLLHLIREHTIDIADIPIVQITDHYLAYLDAMEEMNLTVAGEFIVMAATLLEIKSRTLLPKPPRDEPSADDSGSDPRMELAQRLLDYQRYKGLISTLSEWEDQRRQLFFRDPTAVAGQYDLPIQQGQLKPDQLLRALTRLLAEAGAGTTEVTSVHRQKLTLRLAMAGLWRKVQNAGPAGILLEDCLERPLVRLEIVMTFLALLELMRQAQILADQETLLGSIRVRAARGRHAGGSTGE